MLSLFMACAPLFVSAAEVGQWFSPVGDTVTVRRTRDDHYSARIETSKDGAECTFERVMEEVEEGDLRFREPGCNLRILQQDESVLSVSVSGCSRYCQPGVNLKISRAVKD